jgi:hypothetical protein
MRPDRELRCIDYSSAPPGPVSPVDLDTIHPEIKRRPQHIFPFVICILFMLCALPLSAQEFVSPYPEEPERYDSEYYLDILTMRYNPEWRDYWDGCDKVFRLRFGSLNVEQWNLEEELKFSVRLSDRFRFRYWMESRFSLEESALERNELELEFRARGPYYLSFYLAPSFWKRENDIGLGFQRRTEIDRYVTLALRVLDFANDFAYEHGENIEGEENLYRVQPLRLSLSSRERIGRHIRFGLDAFATNRWEMESRRLDDPLSDYALSSRGRDGRLWMEYLPDPDTRFGLEVRAAEYSTERTGPDDQRENHRIREFLPYLERDALIGGGVSLRAGLQVRRERWAGEGASKTGSFRKDELLPFATASFRFGGSHMAELGYLSDLYDAERTGGAADGDERTENRLMLAYELSFGERGRIRVIETIDLDREDWGQFSIHDHFFLQTAFRF